MVNTFNREPVQQGIKRINNRVLNFSDWKGWNDNNFVNAALESFSSCDNVFINNNNCLSTRPNLVKDISLPPNVIAAKDTVYVTLSMQAGDYRYTIYVDGDSKGFFVSNNNLKIKIEFITNYILFFTGENIYALNKETYVLTQLNELAPVLPTSSKITHNLLTDKYYKLYKIDADLNVIPNYSELYGENVVITLDGVDYNINFNYNTIQILLNKVNTIKDNFTCKSFGGNTLYVTYSELFVATSTNNKTYTIIYTGSDISAVKISEDCQSICWYDNEKIHIKHINGSEFNIDATSFYDIWLQDYENFLYLTYSSSSYHIKGKIANADVTYTVDLEINEGLDVRIYANLSQSSKNIFIYSSNVAYWYTDSLSYGYVLADPIQNNIVFFENEFYTFINDKVVKFELDGRSISMTTHLDLSYALKASIAVNDKKINVLTNSYLYRDNKIIDLLFDIDVPYLSNIIVAVKDNIVYSDSSLNAEIKLLMSDGEKDDDILLSTIYTKFNDRYLFAYKNTLYISAPYDINKYEPFYFPLVYKHKLNTSESVQSLLQISDNIVAIFTKSLLYYCTLSDNLIDGLSQFVYSQSFLNIGIHENSNAILDNRNKPCLLHDNEFKQLIYEDFVQSSDKIAESLSDNITKSLYSWLKNAQKITVLSYSYWSIFCKNDNTLILYDTRNGSWWKWSFSKTIEDIYIYNDLLYIRSDNIYRFDFDFGTEYSDNGEIINWHFDSILLYVSDISKYKHIVNVQSYIVEAKERISYKCSVKVYNKRETSSKPVVIESTLPYMQNNIMRVNYMKTVLLQYRFENDNEAAQTVPIIFNNISIKYYFGDEVR